ncbi:MAG: hypothetical protein ACM3JJ_11450 [Hyphomicrobiales bacterium]
MRRHAPRVPVAGRRPGHLASAAVVLAVTVLAAGAFAVLAPTARAQDEDTGIEATPDSVWSEVSEPGPLYNTTFDQDRSRRNWTQTLGYFRNSGHVAMNLSGSMTTQEFTLFPNKSTFGQFFGHLDSRPTKHWTLSLEGNFDMNSSTDGTRTTDTRRDRLQAKSQYQFSPLKGMTLVGGLYTEFQRTYDRTVSGRLQPANHGIDSLAVDTLFATRDSSYTVGRKDGILAVSSWQMSPWLQFNGTANASRLRPTQESIVRDFTNPLDGSGGGVATSTRDRTSQPTDNSTYSTRLSFSKLRRSKLDLRYDRSIVNQSFFDKDFRGQELAQFDRSAATAHTEYGPFEKFYATTDVGLIRSTRDYRLRVRSNSLVTTRQLTSTIARSDTTGRFGLTYTVSRSRNERQVTQNGVVVDRTLGGNFMRIMSRRLAIDGLASVGLQSSKYIAADQIADQDIARSMVSIGGGFLLVPACSTTVHFSTNRSHTVSIDPSASGSNGAQTNYQLNATLLYQVSPELNVRQSYVLSADYRIFDFASAEKNNYLNRTRRIDTYVTDSLYSYAYLQLTHNFVFRDQGPYAAESPGAGRIYRVTQENYEQTLALTAGVRITGGVRLVGTQSLLSQRNYLLAQGTSTHRNRFTLTAGLEVNRTLRDGSEIVGAVRHIGGYDERLTPVTKPNEESYWIAGATFQKQF